MTCKEWMKQNHPDQVSPAYIGGVCGCPGDCIEGTPCFSSTCDPCYSHCERCWGQEMPEQKSAKPLTIYIAGPITGVPDYLRAFNRAEKKLLVRGHITLNPARTLVGRPNEQTMRVCLSMIDISDAVLFLPGWDMSAGATLEYDYAKYIGKTLYYDLAEVPDP